MDHIQQNFEKFDRENPLVWELFDQLAWEMLRARWPIGSASTITECIRYTTGTEIPLQEGGIKINNNFRSRLVRKWEARNPLFRGWFRTRALAVESVDSRRRF